MLLNRSSRLKSRQLGDLWCVSREIQEEVVCAAPFPVAFQKHCTSDIKELRQDIKDTQGNVEKKEKAHKKRIYKD